MKRVIIILLAALISFANSAVAQQTKYNYHKTGYWGSVTADGGVLLCGNGGGSNIGISTVHGGRIGHGVAIGLGMGLYVDINSFLYVVNLPVFIEAKYSPLKSGKSPFVSLRTGFSLTDNLDTGFYLAPSIGVDLGRISLFARYGFNLFPTSVDISFPELNSNIITRANIKVHSMSIGVAVNF